MAFEKVRISKDNILLWDKENQEWEIIYDNSLVPFLSNTIEIDPDVTLEDFFRLLEKNEDEYDLIFSSHLGGIPLRYYIEDINRDCPMDDREDLIYLELFWEAGYFDYKKFEKDNNSENFLCLEDKNEEDCLPENPEINISVGFHGWGEWGYSNEQINNFHGGIAIEFMPLRKIKHNLLKLNKTFKFINETDNYSVMAEGENQFSVYDVIGAILYEISFAGYPEERDKKWKEIEAQVNESIKKIEEDKKNNQ